MIVLITGSSTGFYLLPFWQEGRLVVSGSFYSSFQCSSILYFFCLTEIKIGVVQQLPLLHAGAFIEI
ncbi:MAG TPA: hypothetical protein DEG63_08245 [Flavobacteriaceae bacterium]|nr:hypothetical protein [Flavobacteriaceae bacterium]